MQIIEVPSGKVNPVAVLPAAQSQPHPEVSFVNLRVLSGVVQTILFLLVQRFRFDSVTISVQRLQRWLYPLQHHIRDKRNLRAEDGQNRHSSILQQLQIKALA